MNFLKKLSVIFLLFFIFPSEIFAGEPGTVIYRTNYGGGQIAGTPVWQKDPVTTSRFNTTNSIDMTDESIPTGTPENIFKSYRFGPNQNLNLSFPVEPGRYEVRLYFAEISGGNDAVGARIFDVSIEGEKILSNFDVFKTAGKKNRAIKRAFFTTSDSNLNIDLTKIKENPMISGIEILKAGPGNELVTDIDRKVLQEGEGSTINHIDALVIYDRYALEKATANGLTINSYIDSFVKKSNELFSQSGVNTATYVVGLEGINFDGEKFSNVDQFLQGVPVDNLKEERKSYGADIVMFFIADPQLITQNAIVSCGIGPGPEKNIVNADTRFSLVINLHCDDIGYNLAHETGHLLSAKHEESDLTPEARANALYTYSRAYTGEVFSKGTRYTYATMDYSAGYNKKKYVFEVFSKNDVANFTLPNGEIVTVPIGNQNANNTLAMNDYAPTVATYSSAIKNIDPQTVYTGKISFPMETVREMQAGSWGILGTTSYSISSDGVVSGNPQVPESITFTVFATDKNETRHERKVTLNVLQNPLQNPEWSFDVNADGKVSEADAVAVENYLKNNGGNYGAVDVNKDSKVTIDDVSAVRNLLNNPLTPLNKHLDVNSDGIISAQDVLSIYNFVNTNGMKKVTEYTPELIANSKKVDVNGDGYVTPSDALGVINYINTHPH